MATIREMAIKYAPYPTDNNWDIMQKQLTKLSAYEMGAGEALKEIEEFADKTWGANSLNTISLKKKIRELKGK